MDMLRYAGTSIITVTVPVVPSPARFRLREIIIDQTLKQLIICTGQCANNDDWPISVYSLLVKKEEITNNTPILPLKDLSNSLVFPDRDKKIAQISAPTIEVGIYDSRRLTQGELFYDPYAKILYVGYPPEEDQMVYLRCRS